MARRRSGKTVRKVPKKRRVDKSGKRKENIMSCAIFERRPVRKSARVNAAVCEAECGG